MQNLIASSSHFSSWNDLSIKSKNFEEKNLHRVRAKGHGIQETTSFNIHEYVTLEIVHMPTMDKIRLSTCWYGWRTLIIVLSKCENLK